MGRPQSQQMSSSHRKEPPVIDNTSSWMTTFVDLVTLLLTFLVLMVSISTVDTEPSKTSSPDGVLVEKEGYVRLGNGILLFSDLNLLVPIADMLTKQVNDIENIDLRQDEIKNAIFQLDEANTPNFEQLKKGVDQHVNVFQDDRGIVIQWDRNLLFPEGSSTIYDENLLLLQKIAVLILNMDLPISIESHTNPLSPLEGSLGPKSYELSFERSKAVMKYLVSLGIPEKRFRIGAHGGAHPRTLNFDSIKENSRLEIILYRPTQKYTFGS